MKYEIVPVAPLGVKSRTVDIFTQRESGYHYGDLLRVSGKVLPPDSSSDSPAMFSAKISLFGKRKGFWPRQALIDFKNAILQKFNDVLPQDDAALLGGITIGGTAGMSNVFKNEMELSGTSYIATMYGFKITIIVFALSGALLGVLPRRAVFLLATLAIILFVIMSGGNASAVRAGIMTFLALSARESGRILHKANALAYTAFVMVIGEPTLIVSAAFQLSFLSILGILYLAPPIKAFIHYKGPGLLEWRESAVIASATLWGIMPIVLASFGSFSLTSFLSNTLVMPAVLPLALLGFAIATLGSLVPYVTFVLAKLAEVLLWYERAVIGICARIIVPLPAIFGMPLVIVCYYAATIIFIRYYENK